MFVQTDTFKPEITNSTAVTENTNNSSDCDSSSTIIATDNNDNKSRLWLPKSDYDHDDNNVSDNVNNVNTDNSNDTINGPLPAQIIERENEVGESEPQGSGEQREEEPYRYSLLSFVFLHICLFRCHCVF